MRRTLMILLVLIVAMTCPWSHACADILGYETQFGSQQNKVNGIQAATQVTLAVDDTVTEMTAYVNGGPPFTQVRYAIYTDTGGEPGALIVQSANASKGPGGWLTIDIPDTNLTAGTYWLALSGNHNGLKYAYDGSGGQSRHNGNNATSGGFSNSWGGSSVSHSRRISIYAACTMCQSGGGGGLMGHWKLDESSGHTATDSSGGGYHGTLTNFGATPGWGSARVDGGLEFDGVNDYIEIPGFPNATGSFTITAWVRSTDGMGDQRIFADDKHNSDGFALSIGDGGDRRIRFFSRDINPVSLDTSQELTADNWHFIAAVHDASQKKRSIYIDGELAAEDSSSYSGTWGTDSGPASIGGEVDGTGEGVPNWRLGGWLDDVRFYDLALTDEQIDEIHAEAEPTYRMLLWTEVDPR